MSKIQKKKSNSVILEMRIILYHLVLGSDRHDLVEMFGEVQVSGEGRHIGKIKQGTQLN